MKKIFGLLILFSAYAFAACDTSMSESHTQVCENHTVDPENHDAVCCSMTLPVAEYRFDTCQWDGTTDEVVDSSDNGYHATTYHGTQPKTGWINRGAEFTGGDWDNAKTIETSSQIIDTEQDFTIMFWMKVNDIDTSKTWTGVLAKKIEFYITKDREVHVNMKNQPDQESFSSDKNIFETGKWYHIAIRSQGRSIKMYLNGNIVIDETMTKDKNEDDLGLLLGKTDWEGAPPFNGILDELKLYQNALTNDQINSIYNNEKELYNYDGTQRDGLLCPDNLLADYRFDECSWNGTDGEVKDSSGNDLNGVEVNGTSPSEGKINNCALFDGTDDYIDTGKVLSPGETDKWSVSLWFKSDTTNGEQLIFNKESVYEAAVRDGYFQYAWQPHWDWDGGESFPVEINTWYHVVITYDGVNQIVYKNGEEVFRRAQTGNMGSNDDDSFLIGNRSAFGNSFFDGSIDELKVFDTALTANQVQEIYNNESAHKNYDGSHRMAIDCTTPVLLAEYRFDECRYTGATGEVIDSEGGDNSGTITGDANLSKDEKKIGHALHLNGGAVDIDDLAVSTEQYKKNTVMFWMYWDNTDNVMPFGWNTYDLWFNNGDFGFNARKSLIYGINSASIKNGWHHVTAVFTNGDVYSNRLYIDGILKAIEQKKGTLENNNAYATPSARIGGWKRNNYYRFKGYLDELKIYKGEVNATTIASIYNSEKDLIRTITCAQAIFNAVNRNGGCFNWENNITTKIAGDPIALTILAADQGDTNSSIQDANITKLELLSFSDPTCDTLYDVTEIWSGNSAVDGNGCWNPTDFIHDKAIRCAKIRISGIFEGNSVESNSTDTFSIRPKTFVLQNIPSGKLTAEHTYTLKAIAVNSDGTTQTADYNTTVTPQANKYLRDGSDGSAMAGTFVPTTDFIFSDGAAADTALSFDNVGIVGLDLNDTTWAAADSDDTPLIDRTIYLERNLTFIPDHFKVEFPALPTMENNTTHYTYLSNDLNMSAWLKNLSVKITAEGERNGTMTNYQIPRNTYYANSVDITPTLEISGSPRMANAPQAMSDQNLSFSGGVATFDYQDVRFNYERNRSNPVDPFTLDGDETNLSVYVKDRTDTTVEGNATTHFSGSATFYYGRVLTEDIRTQRKSAYGNLRYLLYSSTPLSGFSRESVSWYLNKYDTASLPESADFDPRSTRSRSGTDLSAKTAVSDLNASVGGVRTFEITRTGDGDLRAIYHLDIPSWLWYSRYRDYSFSTASGCGEHPCFEYLYQTESSSSGIRSGSFGGSRFGSEMNSSIKKRAIKIMR